MLPAVYARDLAAAKRALSPEAFAASWVQGRGLERAELLSTAWATRAMVTGSGLATPQSSGHPTISLTARERDVPRHSPAASG